MAFERVVADLLHCLVRHHHRRLDGVEPECPQRLPLVAPGIEVPVVPVVHEPLRRHLTVEHLAVLPTLVTQLEALAREHRRGDRAEVGRSHAPRSHRQDLDAPRDVLCRMLARIEQALQPLAQRRDQFTEHARLQVAEQAVHRQQRLQLVRREPEARQLPQLAVGDGGIEAVGFLVAVVHDRRVHAIPQVLEVALEGRARDAEFFQEVLRADEVAAPQQVLDLVEAFGPFHQSPPSLGDQGARSPARVVR